MNALEKRAFLKVICVVCVCDYVNAKCSGTVAVLLPCSARVVGSIYYSYYLHRICTFLYSVREECYFPFNIYCKTLFECELTASNFPEHQIFFYHLECLLWLLTRTYGYVFVFLSLLDFCLAFCFSSIITNPGWGNILFEFNWQLQCFNF